MSVTTLKHTKHKVVLHPFSLGGFLRLFLTLAAFLPFTSSQVNQELSNFAHGVHLQQEGELVLSKAKWTVVTDVTYQPLEDLLNATDTALRLGSQALPLDLSKEPDLARKAIYSRLQKELKSFNRQKALMTFRVKTLQQTLRKPDETRGKRGIINAGGDLLKWLFGTANADDLELIHKKLLRIGKQNENMLHLVEDQVSLINNSFWATQRNSEVLEKLQRVIVNFQASHIQLSKWYANLTEDIILEAEIDTLIRSIEETFTWLEQSLENLGMALIGLATGKLTPMLIHPDDLGRALTLVQQKLPLGWEMIAQHEPGGLWSLYQSTRVRSALFEGNLRLFIELDLYEPLMQLRLFRVITMPVPLDNSGLASIITGVPAYVAITADQQLYTEITRIEEIDGRDRRINRDKNNLIRLASSSSCISALILKSPTRISKDCSKIVEKCQGSYLTPLTGQAWLYSTCQPLDVTLSCGLGKRRGSETRTIRLSGIGILNIPTSCSAHSDRWVVPAEYRGEATLANRKEIPELHARLFNVSLFQPLMANLSTPANFLPENWNETGEKLRNNWRMDWEVFKDTLQKRKSLTPDPDDGTHITLVIGGSATLFLMLGIFVSAVLTAWVMYVKPLRLKVEQIEQRLIAHENLPDIVPIQ